MLIIKAKRPEEGMLAARSFMVKQLCTSRFFPTARHAEAVFGKPGESAPLPSKRSFLLSQIEASQGKEMEALLDWVADFFSSLGKANKVAHSVDAACLCLIAAKETRHPSYASLARIGLCHDVLEANGDAAELENLVSSREYKIIKKLTNHNGLGYYGKLAKYVYPDPVAGWIKTKDLCAKIMNPHGEKYAETRALRIFINASVLADSRLRESQGVSLNSRLPENPISSEMVAFAVRLVYEIGNPDYSERIYASSGLSESDPSVAGASMFFRLRCGF